ncbi:MAG: DUF4139 domain-containing protein [Candidatus Cloacimonadales bacterium]|nr:DUF4139 domain-containing protein [Candidatus Cloacimonadales bacterium]
MRQILIALLVILAFSLYANDQITIYNDNFSLVRSSLELKLEKGLQSYFMDDIPSTIEAASVIIKPLNGKLEVFSQNYEYDLAGTAQILYKYIGKEVEIITKTDQVFLGILQFNDFSTIGILDSSTNRLSLIQYSEIRNINLAELPDNFFLKPTLQWQLNSEKAGTYNVDFSYLCYGMKWDVTYNSVWDDAAGNLEINSWVTINNSTGKAFMDTKLKLIAGDVSKELQYKKGGRTNEVMYSMDAEFAASPEFEEKAFHDFHMYTLSENVSINNNQTKQLRLFPVKTVKAKSKYTYQTYSEEIISKIEFTNSKKEGLGLPLPKGTVKIYKKDTADDQLEFIGEDNIDHTATDEKVTLTTGKAFDLVGKTTVQDSRKISNKVTEKDMVVTLKNRSKETKEITVIHNVSGNWIISQENIPYEKKSAYQIEFTKTMKAGEEFDLTWTERISY